MDLNHHLKPQHVLMTADTVGGVWTYALELARALNPQGVTFTLATMGAPTTAIQRKELRSLSNVQLQESTYKLEWMQEPWKDLAAAGDWLLELERRVQPELVHLNGYAHGALSWTAPALVAGHSCVLSWWRAVHGTDAPHAWAQYREVVTCGLHGADLVVAPSQTMLAALNEHYGPLEPTRVIPNGRKLPNHGRRVKENLILTAGRVWDPAKNISILDAIAPKLCWPLYVAGAAQGPDGRTTEHSHLKHLGYLSAQQLAEWYARAAIYAFPARYEPFGLSVLEAALAGCALVLGDIPSLREIWNGAAVFVDPMDRDSLQAALTQLVHDEDRRAALASEARRIAIRFTPETMANNYLDAYRNLLSRRRNTEQLEPQAA